MLFIHYNNQGDAAGWQPSGITMRVLTKRWQWQQEGDFSLPSSSVLKKRPVKQAGPALLVAFILAGTGRSGCHVGFYHQ